MKGDIILVKQIKGTVSVWHNGKNYEDNANECFVDMLHINRYEGDNKLLIWLDRFTYKHELLRHHLKRDIPSLIKDFSPKDVLKIIHEKSEQCYEGDYDHFSNPAKLGRERCQYLWKGNLRTGKWTKAFDGYIIGDV